MQWLPVGKGNPFDQPILDIRSVTLHMISTTQDSAVAENFSRSRSIDGREFIDQHSNCTSSFSTDFSYPHNGEELEGIVFKSSAMEVKWDIYAYGEWFYFVRSWTSDLVYKVRYENKGDSLVFREVLSHKGELEDAQNVHSIMQTHVFGRVWPYYVPSNLQASNPNDIALEMFSQFGSHATIVTNANVFNIELVPKQASL